MSYQILKIPSPTQSIIIVIVVLSIMLTIGVYNYDQAWEAEYAEYKILLKDVSCEALLIQIEYAHSHHTEASLEEHISRC